jgi:hypothetical protein
MVPVSNGFFSTGSIFKPVLLADALHMLEHGGAAGAHELHVARISVLAERDDAFDGFGGFERDVEKHEVGARRASAARNVAPSANSSVSMPLPCRTGERKCRMLPSTSVTKQSGVRASSRRSSASRFMVVATDFAGAGLALIAKPVNARRER